MGSVFSLVPSRETLRALLAALPTYTRNSYPHRASSPRLPTSLVGLSSLVGPMAVCCIPGEHFDFKGDEQLGSKARSGKQS